MGHNKSFGILCESENGVDEFGNPAGDRILLESTGKMLNYEAAQDRCNELNENGRFGKCIIVELKPTF